jgi:hypothetical protein
MIPKSGHRFSEKIMFQQKIRPSPCSSERIRLPPGNIAMRFRRACLVALLLAFSYVLGCTVAHTASLDEALAHFTTDDFGETIVGVNEVAASGDPRALIIIRALQDGQLLYSAQKKAVYLKNESGKLTDGATGQSIAGPPPADLESVRLNNRLRGTIEQDERTANARKRARQGARPWSEARDDGGASRTHPFRRQGER